MINVLEMMTDSQFSRWGKVRALGRKRYVLKRTLLYGAIIPSLILWAGTMWISFSTLIVLLILLSLPVDYALARLSWAFQESRYEKTQRAMESAVIASSPKLS
jgi:hypothetical protein